MKHLGILLGVLGGAAAGYALGTLLLLKVVRTPATTSAASCANIVLLLKRKAKSTKS